MGTGHTQCIFFYEFNDQREARRNDRPEFLNPLPPYTHIHIHIPRQTHRPHDEYNLVEDAAISVSIQKVVDAVATVVLGESVEELVKVVAVATNGVHNHGVAGGIDLVHNELSRELRKHASQRNVTNTC